MIEVGLLGNLGIALAAAFVGGLVAHWVRLPAIVGYLLAGILVGPYTPGLVANQQQVDEIAEIGVVLLMFALGSEFSLAELRRAGLGVILSGILAILLTTAAGGGIGLWLGIGLNVGVYMGALVALSSSVVILKVLLEHGESDSVGGRLALSVAILQDLSLVVLAVLLPNLAASDKEIGTIALAAAVSLGKAVLLLVGVYLVGTRLLPWALQRIAANTTRELFLLTVIAVAVLTALGAELAGLSFAVGAFVGGLVITDAELAHSVVEEITPLRDLFIALFFVSVGMLINPSFIFANLGAVLIFAALIVLGKAVLFTLLFALFGYPLDTSVKAATLLAQIGEFSFVLAGTGVSLGLLDDNLYGLILAGALLSIVATPLLVAAAPTISRLFIKLPISKLTAGEEQALGLQNHVVICGYGRVGSALAAVLQRKKIAVVIIENEQSRVQAATADGLPAIYGDAANPDVLDKANPKTAALIVVVMSNAAANYQVISMVRQLYPNLPTVVRATTSTNIAALRELGATAVIQPEIEAAMTVARDALQAMGVTSTEARQLIAAEREQQYQR